MCLQCTVNAKALVRNIIPGYSLMISMKDNAEWPKGWYGLVSCNDPDFVWEQKPLVDPWVGLTDEQIDACSKKQQREWLKFAQTADKIAKAMRVHPEVGWRFVEACRKAGFGERAPKDPSKISHNVFKEEIYSGCPVYWFVNHAARKMKKKYGRKHEKNS